MLLGDDLAPLTRDLGFLRMPPEEVPMLLERTGLASAVVETGVQGTLSELLLQLQPLSVLDPPYMFVPTADPVWTAMFAGKYRLGWVKGKLGFYSYHGVEETFHADLPCPPGGPSTAGFTYINGDPGAARTARAENDYGRWSWYAVGPVADFEDVDRYQARRIKDRMTPELIESYARTLGLRIFDEDFYRGPATIVRSTRPQHPDRAPSLSLAEARAEMGITG